MDTIRFCFQKAAGLYHPGHFVDGVHEVLAELFDKMSCSSRAALSMERTSAMRKWVLRSAELRAEGVDGKEHSAAHAKKILSNKNLKLFAELVEESGSPDAGIAEDIANGFDRFLQVEFFPSSPLMQP